MVAARMRAQGYEVFQAPHLPYVLSVSEEQNTVAKLLRHQRLFGRAHPYILLRTRNTSAGVAGERAGANRRARLFLRVQQAGSTAALALALGLAALGASAFGAGLVLAAVLLRQARALSAPSARGPVLARRASRLLGTPARPRRLLHPGPRPGPAAPGPRVSRAAHRLTMAESPETDTRDREYTERLIRLQRAPWKRWLDVQAPYRWNLRRLAPGFTLEVGCGIGRNLEHLRGEGVGLDHNPYSVAAARQAGPARLHPRRVSRLGVGPALGLRLAPALARGRAHAPRGALVPPAKPSRPRPARGAAHPRHPAGGGLRERPHPRRVHGPRVPARAWPRSSGSCPSATTRSPSRGSSVASSSTTSSCP